MLFACLLTNTSKYIKKKLSYLISIVLIQRSGYFLVLSFVSLQWIFSGFSKTHVFDDSNIFFYIIRLPRCNDLNLVLQRSMSLMIQIYFYIIRLPHCNEFSLLFTKIHVFDNSNICSSFYPFHRPRSRHL